MVIPCIVQNHHHALALCASAQQEAQKLLKGLGIKDLAQAVGEFACGQAHRTKASHGLARGGMQEYGVFDLGSHPHPSACAMLLEMTFIQAPQLNVLESCQTALFF